MMTRKHFKMVAEIIQKIENLEDRRTMTEKHAAIFARENPRFNGKKFFQACGV
jgi:hypothetical protein